MYSNPSILDGDHECFASRLRHNPATAKARLIAVTGYGQHDDRRRSYEAGFDEHLFKAVESDVLQNLLLVQ